MSLKELIEKGVAREGKINGVWYRSLQPHADERGFFLEVAKEGELFIPIKQTSFTISHPGIIKAFHWHDLQTDLWFGAFGRARVVLHDLRKNSPTYQCTDNSICIGEPNYVLLLIPPGVSHGYQVLGNKDFGLFYHTDNPYNPDNPDENREPYDAHGREWWEIKPK
jgi:dTDP-4-dehydrorhamnose 3,5-epimerase